MFQDSRVGMATQILWLLIATVAPGVDAQHNKWDNMKISLQQGQAMFRVLLWLHLTPDTTQPHMILNHHPLGNLMVGQSRLPVPRWLPWQPAVCFNSIYLTISCTFCQSHTTIPWILCYKKCLKCSRNPGSVWQPKYYWLPLATDVPGVDAQLSNAMTWKWVCITEINHIQSDIMAHRTPETTQPYIWYQGDYIMTDLRIHDTPWSPWQPAVCLNSVYSI